VGEALAIFKSAGKCGSVAFGATHGQPQPSWLVLLALSRKAPTVANGEIREARLRLRIAGSQPKASSHKARILFLHDWTLMENITTPDFW
jgi:hypothetical protein